ncbi:hypothetical protein SARC_16117, partial [Sphaeroforma arctica JP610]
MHTSYVPPSDEKGKAVREERRPDDGLLCCCASESVTLTVRPLPLFIVRCTHSVVMAQTYVEQRRVSQNDTTMKIQTYVDQRQDSQN